MEIQLSSKHKALCLISALAGLTLMGFQNCAPEGAFNAIGASASVAQTDQDEESLAQFSQGTLRQVAAAPKPWEQDLPVVYVNDPKQYGYEP